MNKTRGRKPDPTSKRSQGIDRHTRPRIVVHVPPDLLADLRTYVSEARPPSTMTAAVVMILEEGLEKRKARKR